MKDNNVITKELKSLEEQLKIIKKHLKWCEDNNKPKDHQDAHIKVIKEIKTEIKNLQK